MGNGDEDLLTINEYNKFIILYEEIEFSNINKKYSENVDDDLDIEVSEEKYVILLC